MCGVEWCCVERLRGNVQSTYYNHTNTAFAQAVSHSCGPEIVPDCWVSVKPTEGGYCHRKKGTNQDSDGCARCLAFINSCTAPGL